MTGELRAVEVRRDDVRGEQLFGRSAAEQTEEGGEGLEGEGPAQGGERGDALSDHSVRCKVVSSK